MLIARINWLTNNVQVITNTGTYTCPMEERDDDFYFKFKKQWHSVSEYANDRLDAEIKSHKQGVFQKRDAISQSEFESICREVLSNYSNILDYRFDKPGIIHISYPSHSGRSRNGATLYFGESGYITYKGWQYDSDNNKGIFIGEEISDRIHSALYDD